MLSLLSMITNGKLNIGVQIADAQSMGSEITFYPCQNSSGQYYYSTTPCDNWLDEVNVCACKYCLQQMSCDLIPFHTCYAKSQYNNGSPYPPTYDNGSNNGSNNSSNNSSNSGGPSSGSGNGGDSGPTKDDGMRHGRSFDNYDNELAESFGHNIHSPAYKTDMQKTLEDPSRIVQNNSTCSAAVLEKCLAELRPDLFKTIATDLYYLGKSNSGKLEEPNCMWDYRSDYLLSHTPYNNGGHVVDLLIQTALINTMNANKNIYDPTKDQGNFSDWGWQTPSAVSSMLSSLFGSQNITTQIYPSFDYVNQIDFAHNFVIVLCNPNPNEKDQNLNGNITNQHYAELTHISGKVASYWSWQNQNTSDDTNRFEYIYIIKK